MTALPSDAPPPGRDLAERARWLRTMLAGVRDDAAIEMFGGDAATFSGGAECDCILAAIELARANGWPREEAIAIARGVWRNAKARAISLSEALRRRVWPLGVAHAPGEEIVAAGRSVCDAMNIFLPDEVLIPQLRSIAHAAAAPRRRRRLG
jgi:hypothetical protein